MSLALDLVPSASVEVRNVDLAYTRKARGTAPLSRFAVQDDGATFASVPDEMEVRSSHLVRFSPTGKPATLQTYSVETLRKVEIATTGETFIGSTDDDLYVFKDSKKSRFLSDRRADYTDIALSESGSRFGTVFCDMLAAHHTVALGDQTGRTLWTKDLPFAASTVAVSRDGSVIAVGGEDGDLWLLDNARNTVLKHRQEAAMQAVAVAGANRVVFASGGGTGLINADGQLLWFTEITGEPVAVATDAGARTVGLLAQTDTNAGRLVLVSGENGLPVWEIDYEDSRPTGLSMSANGEFVGVSLRDGTICVYKLFYGDRLAAADGEAVLAEARAARSGDGSLLQAVALLQARLVSVPSDFRACDLLQETLRDAKEQALALSANAEEIGDFLSADERLAEIQTVLPGDADLFRTRQSLRQRWNTLERTLGEKSLAVGDAAAAEAHLLYAIVADPLDSASRERLADARFAAATAATADGRKRMAQGAWADSVAAFTEAQKRGASGPEITQLLKQARVGEAMALGNALYNDRQYAPALFQFKKVLRLDPDHAEAKQRIAYAQNFLQDAGQITERFTRLE
ncbi:MAG: PQQ-binding-like beta-propeller repeat protein [Akkermansiaceae bacterium]|nr:PQQ-binding-like beta-propeller repeat protein [Armatimonadota bacterium]